MTWSCNWIKKTTKEVNYESGDWYIYRGKWGSGHLIYRTQLEDSVFVDIYHSKETPPKPLYIDRELLSDTFKLSGGALSYKINNTFSVLFNSRTFYQNDTLCDWRGTKVSSSSFIMEGADCFAPYFSYKENHDSIYVYYNVYKNKKENLVKGDSFFGIEFNPKVGVISYSYGRVGKVSLLKADKFGYPR